MNIQIHISGYNWISLAYIDLDQAGGSHEDAVTFQGCHQALKDTIFLRDTEN